MRVPVVSFSLTLCVLELSELFLPFFGLTLRFPWLDAKTEGSIDIGICSYISGHVPANELQIYTWKDASLKELTSLVREVRSNFRKESWSSQRECLPEIMKASCS